MNVLIEDALQAAGRAVFERAPPIGLGAIHAPNERDYLGSIEQAAQTPCSLAGRMPKGWFRVRGVQRMRQGQKVCQVLGDTAVRFGAPASELGCVGHVLQPALSLFRI